MTKNSTKIRVGFKKWGLISWIMSGTFKWHVAFFKYHCTVTPALKTILTFQQER